MDHSHVPHSFIFEHHSIRVLQQAGEIWFVAADLFTALDMPNNGGVFTHLAEDEVVRAMLPNPDGTQNVILVSEPALYRLLKRTSRMLSKRFIRWLVQDVLPRLRPESPSDAAPGDASTAGPVRTLYDLDYVRDYRQDDRTVANARWWDFKRQGAMADDRAYAQGTRFFRQTQWLAKTNPGDAEQALTASLLHQMGGMLEGYGLYYCELAFCRLISQAAVAWMRASEWQDWPPVFKVD